MHFLWALNKVEYFKKYEWDWKVDWHHESREDVEHVNVRMEFLGKCNGWIDEGSILLKMFEFLSDLNIPPIHLNGNFFCGKPGIFRKVWMLSTRWIQAYYSKLSWGLWGWMKLLQKNEVAALKNVPSAFTPKYWYITQYCLLAERAKMLDCGADI